MSQNVRGTVTNLLHALSDAAMCGFEFRHANDGPLLVRKRGGKWHYYTDADYLEIQLALERIGFRTVPKSRVRGVASMVGKKLVPPLPSY
ncbi:hypothetical protein BurMR1_3046 [Burkholderia sp. MR1]|nr:hypothetical protein BurMR1_3046 [Burkholderia sp. MR1]